MQIIKNRTESSNAVSVITLYHLKNAGIEIMLRNEIGTMKNNDDISTMKDPFSHGMPLINFDWIKMYLFGLILIPLRIFAILVLSTAIWLVVTLALWKLKDEERNQRPLCGWRKRCKKFIQFLARLVHIVMGFKVELRGLYSNEAAILIALPHTTLFDIFLPHWIENIPCTVTRIKNRKMPVIGKMD